MGNARGCSAALACLAAGMSAFGLRAADATVVAPIRIGPTADTYISSVAPHRDHRTSRRLELSAQPKKRALLRFDIRGVRGPVTRATLRLRALGASRQGFDVRMPLGHGSTQKIGRRIAASGALSIGHWAFINVTSAVRGNGTVSFVLTTKSRRTIALASREAGAALAPRLTVQSAIPSPSPSPLPPNPPAVSDPIPAAPPTSPSSSDTPVVSGRAWVGRTLTASPGTWTGSAPIAIGYQWRSCDKTGTTCADIPGATEPEYMLASGDAGMTLRVAVSAANESGSASTTSEATPVVTTAPPSPVATQGPTISGAPRQDDVLSSSAGKWKGAKPMAFSYQWRRCDPSGANCTDIDDATSPKYIVLPEDVRGTIRVAVTATNEADAVTALSKPTRSVLASGEPFAGALWHMDELKGSTMTDAVGNANGKIKNVSLGQAGAVGTAYRFSSGSIIAVSSKTLNPGVLPFSMTAHVNFTQKPPPSVYDYDLVRKGLSSTSGGDYKMEIFPGGNAYCLFRGSSGESDVSAKGNLADGQWHTITCAKQDNKITVTVDGKTWSSSGKVGSISNSAPLWIGAQSGGVDQYSGLMDEVSIDIG
jgi:concanavalin A-like lectin/glucanase superfamily protein